MSDLQNAVATVEDGSLIVIPKTTAVQRAIVSCRKDFTRYKGDTNVAWNTMMTSASYKALVSIRIELLLFIEKVGTGSKVKKHHKKLSEFFSRLSALNDIDLNSKTYILKVLTPAKKLRAEIDAWKKQSVTNIVSESEIADIEVKVEVATEEVLETVSKAA